MPKQKYTPYNIASVINPELANIDEIQLKQLQGDIKPAKSKQRRFTDNLVGNIKAQLNGDIPVSPLLAYPAAAAITGTILNPITAAKAYILGTAGSEAVNSAVKQTTGKTYANFISDKLDINPEFAEFTNPGYLLAGANKNNILRNSLRNNLLLDNITSNLQLPYKKSINAFRPHLGSAIGLSSSGNVISLPDAYIGSRRNLLKRINKIFASRYGYKSLPLVASKTREETERVIKDLMTQHNTFVRGVRDKFDIRNQTNKLLLAEGLEPTKENRLQYYATHYAPETNAGRASYEGAPGIGPIYTSNSFNVARGYADTRHYRIPGSQYIVRRPLDFSSSNLEDWVTNNEFAFSGYGTTSSRNYFEYELPYYLKTGKSLRAEYLKDNPITVDYDEIANLVTNDYFGDVEALARNASKRRKQLQYYNDKGLIDFQFPTSIVGQSHGAKALARIEDDILLNLTSGGVNGSKFQEQALNKIYKEFMRDHPGFYILVEPGVTTDFAVFKDGDRANHFLFNETPFFEDARINFMSKDYNPDLTSQLREYIDKNQTQYVTDAVKGYYYGRVKSIPKFIQESKKVLYNKIQQAIKSQYAKKARVDISEYAKNKGLKPIKQRTIVFPDRRGKNVTINSNKNPWQHFIFSGPIGKQGLEIVRKIPYYEIEQYPSSRGGHIGPWTKGLSRKVKRFGGRLSLKGGGATTASLAFMVPRELRRKLYKHINPYGDYHILGNYKNVITKAEPDYGNIVKKDGQYFTEYQDADSNIGIVDDIWAKYLDIPRSESHYFRGQLQKSKYRPTKGGSRFTTYYKLPLTDEEKANIVYQTDGLKLGQNLVSEELAQYNLGQHTVGRGKDKKGEYRSYYDRWDLNPFIDKYQGTRIPILENIGDMSFGLGKPVHIYDRIYLDDYYGVPRQGATYLPELEIWNDDENLRFGYRNGGRISLKYGGIHINPKNRGKFTETMRRTGKTAEELSHSKNPLTRKRAIFALNARKWKH